jgi:uncharacterized protein YutE (UPF0331/DUF86 family)
MSPGEIRSAIVTERVAWIRNMIQGIRSLPLSDFDTFVMDSRTPAAGESYLRRGLEALFDLGRHVLAKGFALAPSEYKEISDDLVEVGVLSKELGVLLRQMAGYRNRMVHFYHEISQKELYLLCTQHVSDIEKVCEVLLRWLQDHPEKLDATL